MTKKQNKIAIYFLLITFISSCQKRSTKHSVETSKDSKPEEVVEISIESESDNEENNSANEIDPIGYSCGLKNFLPKIKFEKQSKKLKIIFESESKIEFSKPDFDLSSDDLNSIKFLAFAECEGENCCTNQKKICCLSPANEDPAIKDSVVLSL